MTMQFLGRGNTDMLSFPTGVPRRATSGRREPENRAPTVHPDARRARRPRAIFSDFALRFCIGILYQF